MNDIMTGAPDLDADAALLSDAVRAGGARALDFFGRDPATWDKRPDDPVSEADIAVNDLLKVRLLGERPGYGWLSEESEDDPARLSCARVWVVDPIDGTRAFLKVKPEFVISVALVADGRPQAAAVFNPATGEFFEAVAGGGARLNGSAIRTSHRTGLAGARLLTVRRALNRARHPEAFARAVATASGSIAYRLALVAAGRFDGVVSLSGKNDWDIAAAELLVREAGGCATTTDGAPFHYNRAALRHPSVIAAGRRLHGKLLEQFSGVLRRRAR